MDNLPKVEVYCTEIHESVEVGRLAIRDPLFSIVITDYKPILRSTCFNCHEKNDLECVLGKHTRQHKSD